MIDQAVEIEEKQRMEQEIAQEDGIAIMESI